ncbi:Uncharacterized protein Adt_11466 [Abeliophyllum distichum]|uniref:Uncharacterized protein n=1 Tax=Abeliophyllum distichum TaxID=126358 RepID=A0ABD1UN11_9LAMI
MPLGRVDNGATNQVIVTMLRRGRKSRGESKAACLMVVVGYHLLGRIFQAVEDGRTFKRQIIVVSEVDWLESLEEQERAGSVHMCWRTLHQQQSVSMGWLISNNQSVWDGLSMITSQVDRLESLKERDCAVCMTIEVELPYVQDEQYMKWRSRMCRMHISRGGDLGPKATASCSGVAVISEYCRGNSSAVEYPLELKLIGLHIEDVSFATDQTERHLEVGNTGYGNYDSSAKRRLLPSLGIFLRSYYKGGMLALLRGPLVRNAVVGQRRMVGRIWQDAVVVGTSMLRRHFKLTTDYQLALLGRVLNKGHCGTQLASMPVRRNERKDCIVGHVNDPQCFGRS